MGLIRKHQVQFSTKQIGVLTYKWGTQYWRFMGRPAPVYEIKTG